MIKPEKRETFKSLMQRVHNYKEENPELFKEVKSWKLFRQMFGGIAGAYVSMWEFVHQELLQLIDPATFSMKIWTSAM